MKRPINSAKAVAIAVRVIAFGFLIMAFDTAGAERAVFFSASIIVWVLALILDELGNWGRL